MLNGWGIYRPQPNSNLELKTIKSRNSGIRRLHLLTGEVAPPGRARRLSLWAVLPLSGAVAPLCQSSKTELRRCHLSVREVAPPSLARRLSSGGATSRLGRLHRPVSLEGLAQAVPPPGLGGCTSWCNQGPNGSFHSAQFQSFRGPIAPRLSQWDHLPFSNLINMLTMIRSKTISAALLRCVNRFFRRVSGELPSIIR